MRSSKLDHAIDCAIALARASKEYGDRVGFIAFDRELRVFTRPKAGFSGVGGIVRATMALSPFPSSRTIACWSRRSRVIRSGARWSWC